MRRVGAEGLPAQRRDMSNELFAAALGLADPWFVKDVQFDVAKHMLTIKIDFKKGSRFPHAAAEGLHKVHDAEIKRYRHLNFFQHNRYLEVRTPGVKLPDGGVVLAVPDWAGKLSGFTLLFEALVVAMCRKMPFSSVAQLVGESWHRVHAICKRYVDARSGGQERPASSAGRRRFMLDGREHGGARRAGVANAVDGAIPEGLSWANLFRSHCAVHRRFAESG
jgi:hypothetical protein